MWLRTKPKMFKLLIPYDINAGYVECGNRSGSSNSTCICDGSEPHVKYLQNIPKTTTPRATENDDSGHCTLILLELVTWE
jgi:hypothetical protein